MDYIWIFNLSNRILKSLYFHKNKKQYVIFPNKLHLLNNYCFGKLKLKTKQRFSLNKHVEFKRKQQKRLRKINKPNSAAATCGGDQIIKLKSTFAKSKRVCYYLCCIEMIWTVNKILTRFYLHKQVFLACKLVPSYRHSIKY